MKAGTVVTDSVDTGAGVPGAMVWFTEGAEVALRSGYGNPVSKGNGRVTGIGYPTVLEGCAVARGDDVLTGAKV